MKRTYWLALIAATLLTGDVYAAGHKAGATPAPKTRQEAIKQLEDRMVELKKMTDEQWAEQKKKRSERHANKKKK